MATIYDMGVTRSLNMKHKGDDWARGRYHGKGDVGQVADWLHKTIALEAAREIEAYRLGLI